MSTAALGTTTTLQSPLLPILRIFLSLVDLRGSGGRRLDSPKTGGLRQRLENANGFVLHSVIAMAFHLKEWNSHKSLFYKPLGHRAILILVQPVKYPG